VPFPNPASPAADALSRKTRAAVSRAHESAQEMRQCAYVARQVLHESYEALATARERIAGTAWRTSTSHDE